MTLLTEIAAAEVLYRQRLVEFFSKVYRNSNLQSHGIEHHHRVWSYCRELLSYSDMSMVPAAEDFPLKLLIAAYLHDAGMSVDPGPRHGHISRKFCEQFLSSASLNVNDFTDTLEAIENHDNKEYHSERTDSPLLTFLTVADDLDALGNTGVYRYIEIYLKRGLPFSDLGNRIGANVTGRFGNFISKFGNIRTLKERESTRFEIIQKFCSDYNDQLKDYIFGTGRQAGHCGIAELIEEITTGKSEIDSLFEKAESQKYDPIINRFFNELRKELAGRK